MANDRFTQYDIMTIWSFLAKYSFARVAKIYTCSPTAIRRIHDGTAYKRETRLVDPDLVAKAEQAVKDRQKRAPKPDVSYLDEVAF